MLAVLQPDYPYLYVDLLKRRTWIEWMSTVPEFVCDPEKPFAELIVPTADTVRYAFLIDRLLLAGGHVLCVGETGTGKTLIAVRSALLDQSI